ncbi:tRNA (adenosine(37)-N6)-threonylcarbamoyltransferase complex dimerization subunit type 1 TsaB [Caballeronia humi]|nr:tRNA (adenosine(37)-N6)-threonylcarbamoyltransferase complex dimerization subunit type 1 TsaB [Caballeronia humi]
MTRTVLLALDTSTEFCSVALLLADTDTSSSAAAVSAVGVPNAVTAPNAVGVPNAVTARNDAAPPYVTGSSRVWFRHEATGAVSSTRLLPAIRELFDDAGLALADCTAIAFGAGPGSFTGLRTATGVAQGLAFGLGVPVVPIGTLLACAEFARLREPSVTRVLAALDARMDEVYWADFEFDPAAGDWRTIRPASLDAPDALVLPDAPFTLAGNGAAAFGERLPAVAAAARVDHEALPHALPVALAGLRALRAGRTVPPELAAPEYVRDKVAQTTAERIEARAAKDARGKEEEPVR